MTAASPLVDTSRSQAGVLEAEREASHTFFYQVLREDKDLAFVAHFDTQVGILQGFTSSRQELAAALDQLRIPGEVATLLYEAIRQTSENLMRKQPGRKAFILLSDGVSFRDKTSIGTAIEYAQRADTIIFSILFSDHPKLYRPGRVAMHAIAAQHGRSAMQRLALSVIGRKPPAKAASITRSRWQPRRRAWSFRLVTATLGLRNLIQHIG